MNVAEALEDVKIAFRQIEFALKISDYWQEEHRSSDEFVRDMTVRLPEGEFHFPTTHFSGKADIIRAAEVAIQLAFGASALALDQALETAQYPVRPDSNEAFDEIRSVIYQVRNAYAHRIAEPVWHASPKKTRVYSINLGGCIIVVDLGRLNGQPFKFEDIGGHRNWFLIRDAVVARLSAAQQGDAADDATRRS